MELWQLRTFRIVAKTLNFTQAAEKLHLTQSAISHQIKALEEDLGVPLFVRAKRGVLLTDAGRTALEYANRILEEAEEMREKVAGLEMALAGRVHVAAATQALVYLFAPFFEEFMDAYETVELVFRTTPNTEQTIKDILNGVADVGFASLPVYSTNLQAIKLFEDELVLVAGKKHRLAKRSEIKVKELDKERWILFERGASIRRATDDFFSRGKIEPETSLESNDTYFMKLMVEHGLGVSLLPFWAVRDEIEKGEFTQIKITGHQLKRSVALVALKGAKSAPIRTFIEYILKQKEKIQMISRNG